MKTNIIRTILVSVLAILFISFSFTAYAAEIPSDNISNYLGDTNSDGSINIVDVLDILKRITASTDFSHDNDINSDAAVNITDVLTLLKNVTASSSQLGGKNLLISSDDTWDGASYMDGVNPFSATIGAYGKHVGYWTNFDGGAPAIIANGTVDSVSGVAGAKGNVYYIDSTDGKSRQSHFTSEVTGGKYYTISYRTKNAGNGSPVDAAKITVILQNPMPYAHNGWARYMLLDGISNSLMSNSPLNTVDANGWYNAKMIVYIPEIVKVDSYRFEPSHMTVNIYPAGANKIYIDSLSITETDPNLCAYITAEEKTTGFSASLLGGDITITADSSDITANTYETLNTIQLFIEPTDSVKYTHNGIAGSIVNGFDSMQAYSAGSATRLTKFNTSLTFALPFHVTSASQAAIFYNGTDVTSKFTFDFNAHTATINSLSSLLPSGNMTGSLLEKTKLQLWAADNTSAIPTATPSPIPQPTATPTPLPVDIETKVPGTDNKVPSLLTLTDENATIIGSAYTPDFVANNYTTMGSWMSDPVTSSAIGFDSSVKKYETKSIKIERISSQHHSVIIPIKPGTLTPGKTYTFQAWVKTDKVVSNSSGAYLSVEFRKTDYFTTAADPVTSSASSGTRDWTLQSVTFTVPQGNDVVVSLIMALWDVTNGTAWYDGIALVERSTPVDDFNNIGAPVGGVTKYTIDFSTLGKTINNKVSTLNMWDFNIDWLFRAEAYADDHLKNSMPFVEYIQFMQATGGNSSRDLFLNPADKTVRDDYYFDGIIRACQNVLDKGLTPFIKTGNVPQKYSTVDTTGTFGVNLFPPDDYDEYYTYIKAVTHALVDEFGLAEVKTWRWGCYTEYENRDWFTINDKKNETFVAFCKIYDYTVAALQSVLGEDIFIGAHSMTCSEGLWDELDFIEHCANGTNYATGAKGTRLSYLAASFYDSTPNSAAYRNMVQTIDILRNKAESVGLTDLKYGIDEGRILSGTIKGVNGWDLNSRVAGQTFQAAYDARILKQMIDNDIDYFATWSYTSTGIWSGLPTVSLHVARNFYEMVGMQQAAVSKTSLGDGNEVETVAAYDSETGKAVVMAYNFGFSLSYNTRSAMLFTMPVVDVKGQTPVKYKVTFKIVDDDSNFFDEWSADCDANGITANDFSVSPDSANVEGNMATTAPRQLFTDNYDKYAKCAEQKTYYGYVTPESGNISLYVEADPNAVVFFELEPIFE